jgi:hypothetical protein
VNYSEVYDASAVFVAPMSIVQTTSFKSFTVRICLPALIEHSIDACRTQLCLLNRQANKQLFINNLRDLLHTRKLGLSQISKVFMKIQTVYK